MKKNKLKITFLDFDDTDNPLLGAGQARATLEICSRLAKKGHTIEVICSKYPESKDRIEKGIKYTHIGISTKHIRLNNLIYIFLLPFIVRKVKCDVIVECFTPPVSTLFTPLFTQIPVVAVSTSFEAERFSEKYHLPFDKIEKFGLRFYKYFLPSSKIYETKMKKANPNVKSKIIRMGVNNDYFEIKSKKGKYLLFLGRFDIHQKGIDLLLKAYRKVASKLNYPLVIAGCGPDEVKIRELIKKYKLGKKVRLLGPTYGEKKMKVLSQAQLFLVPSRNEGFCIAALEALAAGLPVVAFDIPGLSWIPKKVSLKAKVFSVNEFAKLLTQACEKKKNLALRKNSRNVAKKYSWDDVTDEFESFFKLMVRDKKKNKLSYSFI
jgi:glycosyltransferase involved in cell wall biosynthesis